MDIHFYSVLNFHNWDFRTPDSGGIGGSETAHIELAWRLARRGYNVKSYTAIDDDIVGKQWKGTTWYKLEDVDWSAPGLWILFRSSRELDNFEIDHPGQYIWLDLQDETVHGPKTLENAQKIDKCICFCQRHAEHVMGTWPDVAQKIMISSNGIKVDLIRQIEKENLPKRNPKRIIYASSPDRGLLCAIDIFQRARERDKDLELHAYYGTANIETMIKNGNTSWLSFMDELKKVIQTPGVIYHNKVSQPELYRDIFKSGIWLYPTEFNETSCITCMEMQAMGAIPITNPYWALAENVKHGIFIQGRPYNDALVRSRYVEDLVMLANNVKVQDMFRSTMMFNIRDKFNWERIVDQWERWILELERGISITYYSAQYAYVQKHMDGKILNVGCGPDLCQLKSKGDVTNIDICEIDPALNIPNPVDFVADIRILSEDFYNQYDTVILSEVLEHMCYSDIVKSLQSSKKCLNNNGKILITLPFDDRLPLDQKMPGDQTGLLMYADDIPGYHRFIDFKEIKKALDEVGLKIINQQTIDYGFAEGLGLMVEVL